MQLRSSTALNINQAPDLPRQEAHELSATEVSRVSHSGARVDEAKRAQRLKLRLGKASAHDGRKRESKASGRLGRTQVRARESGDQELKATSLAWASSERLNLSRSLETPYTTIRRYSPPTVDAPAGVPHTKVFPTRSFRASRVLRRAERLGTSRVVREGCTRNRSSLRSSQRAPSCGTPQRLPLDRSGFLE